MKIGILLKRVLAALILFVFIIQSGAFADEDTKENNTSSVTGIVVGMTIRKGRIYYVRMKDVEASLEFSSYKALTGEDGRFVIKDVPPGSYRLIISQQGEGAEPIVKMIVVRPSSLTKTGTFTVFLGMDQPLPEIEKGSLVASFADHSEAVRGEVPDNRGSRLIFYRPDSLTAYLEVVLEKRPAWIVAGSDGKSLALADREGKVEFWDLENVEPVAKIRISGIISDFRSDKSRSRLYVSFFNRRDSGIVVIDFEKRKALKLLQPPRKGLFSAVQPINDKGDVYALAAAPEKGYVARLNVFTKSLEALKEVGGKPLSLLYMEKPNKIIVTRMADNSALIIDAESGKTLETIAFKTYPGRVISDLENKKAYISVPNSNLIAVIDVEKNTRIKKIPTGANPYWMIIRDNKLYTANRKDSSITVIDLENDKEVMTTVSENVTSIQGIEFLP